MWAADAPVAIDIRRVRAERLQRLARPLGLEVRSRGFRFALYGPCRGAYLYPQGMGSAIRWLTFDQAAEALDRNLVGPA